MIWSGRRDNPEGDITPLSVITLSLVGYLREILVWSSIQRSSKIVMLRIREEKKKSNTSEQINLRWALKVWSLIQF